MGRIHPGEGHFGMAINRRHDVTLVSSPVANNRIKAEEKTRDRLPLEFGDLPSCARPDALPIHPGLLQRRIVQTCPLDDALDLPCGKRVVIGVLLLIDREEFHLAVAEVFLPKEDDSRVLAWRVFPTSSAVRFPRLVFEATQKIFLETGKPLVKRLAGDAEMPGGERSVPPILFPENNPFEADACGAGEPLQFSDLPPPLVLLPEPVPTSEIPWFEGDPQPALPSLLARQGCYHDWS